MAERTTKVYKNTFSGSVGAGMGSLFNPKGRKYYILEHKVSSKYHKAGETQEIIVDNIELGRDPHCQVRFDESFKTVSRHHAGIIKDGDTWKLVQLSKKNSTFLNGHQIKTEWFLQSGDEIQLSVNGPKLGFIVPTGKKSTVASIGLTRRLSLFRQQALRPYKYALTTLASILVLAIAGLGTWNYFLREDVAGLTQKVEDNSVELAKANEANQKNETLIAELNRTIENQGGVIDSLKKLKPRVIEKTRIIEKPIYIHDSDNKVDMSACHPYVYHITAKPYVNGKPYMLIDEPFKWTGTGFQLDEGKFVTARHVTTPYYSNNFIISDGQVVPRKENIEDLIMIYYELQLNILMQAGRVQIEYECVSTNGSFTLTSNGIQEIGQADRIHTLEKPFRITNPETGEVLAEIPAGVNIRVGAIGVVDFAYFHHSGNGLKANKELSTNLKQGTKLHILGYPHGWGKGDSPKYSEAVCSQDGLSKELGGTIMASNDNTEGGNSGGPIFVKTEKGWEVVAIVSGGTYQKGRFVPIAVVK